MDRFVVCVDASNMIMRTYTSTAPVHYQKVRSESSSGKSLASIEFKRKIKHTFFYYSKNINY